MKLIHNKNGEVEIESITCTQSGEIQITYLKDGLREIYKTDRIGSLTADFKDYEEPKEYWYYDTTKNGIDKITHLEDKEKDQEIGNYFETKEEAERVVEKLKAWKRLKNKKFRFKCYDDSRIYYEINEINAWMDETKKDLDLLFGGEE